MWYLISSAEREKPRDLIAWARAADRRLNLEFRQGIIHRNSYRVKDKWSPMGIWNGDTARETYLLWDNIFAHRKHRFNVHTVFFFDVTQGDVPKKIKTIRDAARRHFKSSPVCANVCQHNIKLPHEIDASLPEEAIARRNLQGRDSYRKKVS